MSITIEWTFPRLPRYPKQSQDLPIQDVEDWLDQNPDKRDTSDLMFHGKAQQAPKYERPRKFTPEQAYLEFERISGEIGATVEDVIKAGRLAKDS